MSPSLWKNRVLVVDDDPIVLAMLKQGLANAGFECLCASTGTQGWQLIKGERPDAVVTDLMLPGAHGLMLLRQIKSDPALRQTPVILMTATGSPQTRAEAQRAGVDAYFDKPFNVDDMVRALQQALRGGTITPPTATPVTPSDEGMVLP